MGYSAHLLRKHILGGEVIIVEREGVAACRIESVGSRPATVNDLLSVLRSAVRTDDEYLDVAEELPRIQSSLPEVPWE